MKTREELRTEAIETRRRFGMDAYAPLDVLNLLLGIENLTVTFLPMSQTLSGMCIRDAGNGLIAVNSQMPLGRQHYTMAHELYHLFYHRELGRVICPSDFGNKKDVKEMEADQFATYFLAPPEALRHFIFRDLGKDLGQLSKGDLIRIGQHFKMSHQAVLWRLVNEKILSIADKERMESGVKRTALRLGFDVTLYEPSPEHMRYMTLGSYIKKATELLEQDLVSCGKYEELLLDAFRVDLVYGDDEMRSDESDSADLF